MSSMLGAGAMSNHVPRRFLDVATSSSSEDTWFCRPAQDGKVLHGKLMEVDCGWLQQLWCELSWFLGRQSHFARQECHSFVVNPCKSMRETPCLDKASSEARSTSKAATVAATLAVPCRSYPPGFLVVYQGLKSLETRLVVSTGWGPPSDVCWFINPVNIPWRKPAR